MKYLVSYTIRGKRRDDDRTHMREILENKPFSGVYFMESQYILKLRGTNVNTIMRLLLKEANKSIFEETLQEEEDTLLVSALPKAFKNFPSGGRIPGYAVWGKLPDDTF